MKSPMQQALKVWRVNKPDDAPADDFDALAAHMWNAAIEAAKDRIAGDPKILAEEAGRIIARLFTLKDQP